MADATGMIVPMLREMRAENAARFDELHRAMRDGFEGVERLAALEGAQNTFRQALTADSLLSKLVPASSKGASKRWNASSRHWRP